MSAPQKYEGNYLNIVAKKRLSAYIPWLHEDRARGNYPPTIGELRQSTIFIVKEMKKHPLTLV